MKTFKDVSFFLLFVIVGFFTFQGAALIVMLSCGGQFTFNGLMIAQWLSNILLWFLPVVLWALWYKQKNPWQYLHFTTPSTRAILLAVFFAAVSIPVGNVSAEWVEMIPWPEGMRSYIDNQLIAQAQSLYPMITDTNPLSILHSILLVSVVTGIAEETFFRGGLRKLFADHVGVHTTAIVIGLIFSIIHFEFYGFIWRWFLGTFYVYLVYYSGSIWTSIIAHAMNNGIAVLMSVFMESDLPMPTSDEEWLVMAKGESSSLPTAVVAVSAVLTLAAIAYFWKNRDKFSKKATEIVSD